MGIPTTLRAERLRGLSASRLVVLAMLVIVTAAGTLVALTRSPLLELRRVEITGASRFTSAEIRRLASVRDHADLVWLDTGAIEDRLEGDPWIARATVSISLPWTLRIAVQERSPVAVARTSQDEVLLAADGTVLGPSEGAADLPRVLVPPTQLARGVRLPVGAVARVVRSLPPSVRRDVATVSFRSDGSLILRLSDGPLLEYGAIADLRDKARAIRTVLRWVREEDATVRSVSVVSPNAPAVSLIP